MDWLRQWKDNLPELPEIDFDKNPNQTFEKIKNLPIRFWIKILENENLWSEGIIKAMFRKGETLKLLLSYFKKQENKPYQELAKMLRNLVERYYP